jgi:hypothetical protein
MHKHNKITHIHKAISRHYRRNLLTQSNTQLDSVIPEVTGKEEFDHGSNSKHGGGTGALEDCNDQNSHTNTKTWWKRAMDKIGGHAS